MHNSVQVRSSLLYIQRSVSTILRSVVVNSDDLLDLLLRLALGALLVDEVELKEGECQSIWSMLTICTYTPNIKEAVDIYT